MNMHVPLASNFPNFVVWGGRGQCSGKQPLRFPSLLQVKPFLSPILARLSFGWTPTRRRTTSPLRGPSLLSLLSVVNYPFVSLFSPYLSLCQRAVPRAPGPLHNRQQLASSIIFLRYKKLPVLKYHRCLLFQMKRCLIPISQKWKLRPGARDRLRFYPSLAGGLGLVTSPLCTLVALWVITATSWSVMHQIFPDHHCVLADAGLRICRMNGPGICWV